MLHRTLLVLLLAAAPLMLVPAFASDGTTLSAGDEAFLHQIVDGCKRGIRTAEAALKRPLTDMERSLAKQQIDLHLTMQRVIATIAKTKQVGTRDEVQADEQGRIVTSGELADKDFNAFFLKGEIASAAAEIALCEAEIRDGADEDLKLFARTYLPGLQKCLAIAREFAAKY